VQSKWFLDCKTEAERQKRKELVENAQVALDILAKICYNSIRDVEKSSEDYSSPSWAFQQADIVGQKKAYNAILKMCEKSKD
jgi:hypothetical protein